MTFLSTAVTLFSLVLLTHSGYSSYEFSHYLKHLTLNAEASLPTDIIIETVVATILFAVGQILAANKLQPVSFARWAKGMEREGKSPFAFLERRPAYMDVKKLRDEYAKSQKS